MAVQAVLVPAMGYTEHQISTELKYAIKTRPGTGRSSRILAFFSIK